MISAAIRLKNGPDREFTPHGSGGAPIPHRRRHRAPTKGLSGLHRSRLSTWAIDFAPEAASLSEGLRAAAACAAIAAAAVLSHWPLLSWAAVSAFWACLIDPGGSTRIRAKLLVAFTLAGTTVSMLCAGMAGLGPTPAVAVLFGLTVIGALLRVYGAEVSSLANILMVAAVYTVSRPMASWSALTAFGLLFLAGCVWASALSLTVWRIHPFAAPRQALAGAFRALAAQAMALAEVTPAPPGDPGWTAHAQHDRRAAREAIEAARASIAQTTGERGGMGAIGARLSAGLNVAEGEFACLIALADTLERRPVRDPDQRRRTVRLIKQLASIFHRLDRYVEDAEDGAAPAVRLAIRRVTLASAAAPAQVRKLIFDCAQEARHVLDEAADPSPDAPQAVVARSGADWIRQTLAPLRAELHPGSLIFRHALRMAISVCFAYLLTRLFHIPYGYWMTMTVVIIQQPYVATTWTRALERVLGSVLGGGLAALLGMAFHSQATLLLLIFPLAMATMAFRRVNYTLFVFFLTPLFVLILDLTHPGERELTLAGVRAMNTVIGGLIALAGVTLLWPASGANRMRLDLAAAIERNGEFASLAVAGPADLNDVDAARRRAGLASNLAEASQQRAALESWWRRSELNGAANVLGVLRRLAGTATTLRLQFPGLDGAPSDKTGSAAERSEAARWAEMATRELATAVRCAAPVPALPSRSWSARRAEDDVLVREIEDLYQAAATLGARRP
jgi:uncharacterized membrane protein YccC